MRADDKTTAYYHLVVPKEEVEPGDGTGPRLFYTAIGQVICFCLMAFQSRQRNQKWIEKAMADAPKWPGPGQSIDYGTTDEEASRASSPRASSPSAYESDGTT